MKYPIPFTEEELEELAKEHSEPSHMGFYCVECRWLETVRQIREEKKEVADPEACKL